MTLSKTKKPRTAIAAGQLPDEIRNDAIKTIAAVMTEYTMIGTVAVPCQNSAVRAGAASTTANTRAVHVPVLMRQFARASSPRRAARRRVPSTFEVVIEMFDSPARLG